MSPQDPPHSLYSIFLPMGLAGEGWLYSQALAGALEGAEGIRWGKIGCHGCAEQF